jgi:hypothetical protein
MTKLLSIEAARIQMTKALVQTPLETESVQANFTRMRFKPEPEVATRVQDLHLA